MNKIDQYQNVRNNKNILRKFYLISDAVALSNECDEHLPIFAHDKANAKRKGAKSFFTGSYAEFWKYYQRLPSSERCFYETILPSEPSHLYLDVEATIKTNSKIDLKKLFERLLTEFKQYIESELKRKLKIIQLDSNTSKKFSKHCIIKIEDSYFLNNFHCGAFVRCFQQYTIKKYGNPAFGGENPFFVWTDKETKFEESKNKVFMIDMGVYTKRRQFRILGSSKRITPRRHIWIERKGTTRKDVLSKNDFFDCLIQYVPSTLTKIKNIIKTKEPNGLEPHSSSLKTFDLSGNPVSIAVTTANKKRGRLSSQLPLGSGQTQLQTIAKKQKVFPAVVAGNNASRCELPYSLAIALKHYIHTNYDCEVTTHKIKGNKIQFETKDRKCFYKYKMTGDLCHRSNNVYFVVDFLNKRLLQGCYNETTCKNGHYTKCVTPLGIIEDGSVIHEINKWLIKCF